MRIILLLSILILLLILCNVAQVLDVARLQPSLSSLSSSLLTSTLDCCQYLTTINDTINDSYKELLSCTISKSKALNIASNIRVVSYYTDSISQYAAYSLTINLAWSHYNSYSYSLLSPNTGHEFDDNDQRWNKVMILLHSIDIDAKKYCKANDQVCSNGAGWAKVL